MRANTELMCMMKSKNTRRRKLLGRLCALMFLGWIYYAFIHKDNYKHHHGNHTDVDSHTTPRNINSPQGSIGYNHCEVDAIDWDGPSIFTTDASNFNLKFGKGSFGSYVQVHQGAVSQPTLRIEGMISPMESVLVKNEQDGGRTISIWHLGLHIEIREDPELFDVLVWFEDRTVVADDGYGYRACATLDIAIILLIDGAVTKINMYNLDKIRFRKLDLETAVGNVIGNDLVLVDEFLVRVKTGKVATQNRPLDVSVTTDTGRAYVGVKTTPLNKDEEGKHRVSVTALTGSAKVDISPLSLEVPSDKKSGDLEVTTYVNTGAVSNTIQLTDASQKLYLTARSSTGAVDVSVSDAFLGGFRLQTKTGSAKVQPTTSSDSEISYMTQTDKVIVGFKKPVSDEDDSADQPQIDLRTSTGRVSLKFTK
ncbi:hypothetical protein BGZ58_009482 [Dissophora ornata]|nr:hypothetical protein BGZ58_009482 [Dissophora ornata]